MKFFTRIFPFLLFVFLFSCTQKAKNEFAEEFYPPEKADIILKINDKEDFLNNTIRHDFWKEYFSQIPSKSVQALLKNLPSQKEIWLTYFYDSQQVTLFSKQADSTHIFQPTQQVKTVEINGEKWYYIFDKTLKISNKNEGLLTPLTQNTDFDRVRKTADVGLPVNVFFSQQRTATFFSEMFSYGAEQHFKGWSAWDWFLNREEVRVSGSAWGRRDSLGISVLGSKLFENQSFNLIPSQAEDFCNFTFGSAENIFISPEISADFLPILTEISFLKLSGNQLVILQSADPEEILRNFMILREETYQEQKIFQTEPNPEMGDFLSVFSENTMPKYVFMRESALIFSENLESLKRYVDFLLRQEVITNNAVYQQLMQKMVSRSPYTEFSQLQHTAFSQKYPKLAKKYPLMALQIKPQDDFFICTLTATEPKQIAKVVENELITPKFQLTLEADISTFNFVTNHRTKEKEIALQDADNQFYLIDNQGKVLWKKDVKAPIRGEIYQVDLFQNGNLQMAFNTAHQLWVLDRNGNTVAPFPLNFSQELLPLQVFDYDGNRNYRFVVASENTIRLIDKKGTELLGFQMQNVPNGIAQTPKHFRFSGKDYIVFPQKNGTLSILHRNGTVRIPISEKFLFSQNPIFAQSDLFTFTTKNAKRYFIDNKGGMRSVSLPFSGNHSFWAGEQLTVYLSDNKLIINKKEIELPYGTYTAPKVFSFSNGIYVTATDLDNSKLYVWNSEGALLRGFPVFASSQAIITGAKHKRLIAFLKGKNTIALYDF